MIAKVLLDDNASLGISIVISLMLISVGTIMLTVHEGLTKGDQTNFINNIGFAFLVGGLFNLSLNIYIFRHHYLKLKKDSMT